MYKSLFLLVFMSLLCNCNAQNQVDNTLTKKEIKDGWQLLFDGKTFDGWVMNPNTGEFFVSGWEVKDGMIVINDMKSRPEGAVAGDIVTKESFTNFEFSFDFMYAKGANSGVKYFINTNGYNGRAFSLIGCEYQVLDDINHPDAKMGKDGNRKLGGLYDLIPPQNAVSNGIDQWNTGKIVVNGNKVQHWVNGKMTVEYERGTDAWRELVAGSKYKAYEGFGEQKETRILLQDHNNLVKYKNIKIREL